MLNSRTSTDDPDSNRDSDTILDLVIRQSELQATASTDQQLNPSTTSSGLIAKQGTADQWERARLLLRRSDQILLGSLLIALVVLLIAFRWKLSGTGLAEIEIASQQPREYFYALNINQASWVEWAQLDGIGETLARRIVKDREDQGEFVTIDDVARVRGVGPKLIEKLRPFLKLNALERDPIDTPRKTIKGSR